MGGGTCQYIFYYFWLSLYLNIGLYCQYYLTHSLCIIFRVNKKKQLLCCLSKFNDDLPGTCALCNLFQDFVFVLKCCSITSFVKHQEKIFRSHSELLSQYGVIPFQEYVTNGIFQPVFYGGIVYKHRRVRGSINFIASVTKIVKRLRRRQYDPGIIEKTIGLVLGTSTATYRFFLKHCTLTNKALSIFHIFLKICYFFHIQISSINCHCFSICCLRIPSTDEGSFPQMRIWSIIYQIRLKRMYTS